MKSVMIRVRKIPAKVVTLASGKTITLIHARLELLYSTNPTRPAYYKERGVWYSGNSCVPVGMIADLDRIEAAVSACVEFGCVEEGK